MFKELIKEICNELDIKYTILSKDWVIKLEKDNISKYIVGNKFDLNGHGIGKIMDDKYAFYDVVNNLSIPICTHHIFYASDNNNEYAIGCNKYEEVLEYFYKYQNNIVLKPNRGSKGGNVYHITNEKDISKILDILFKNNYSISLCPYYEIKNEYRIIVLNNQVKLIFKKIKPVVYGNGINTVKELFMKLNPYYFNDIELPNTLIDKDKEYIYDWKFNLSKGGIASFDIDLLLKDKLSKLALDVSNKVGITFASIDIIELYDGSLKVLEANSGVTINKCTNFLPNGYQIAKDIYKEAIIYMFEK